MPQPLRSEPARGSRPLLLYDGECTFCVAQAARLERMTRGLVDFRSFHEPGLLDSIPGLTIESCMKEMKYVDYDGRIHGGLDAAVRALDRAHPIGGKFLYAYYIPGIRWLADRVYAWVARNRYRLANSRGVECETGSCRRHTS